MTEQTVNRKEYAQGTSLHFNQVENDMIVTVTFTDDNGKDKTVMGTVSLVTAAVTDNPIKRGASKWAPSKAFFTLTAMNGDQMPIFEDKHKRSDFQAWKPKK